MRIWKKIPEDLRVPNNREIIDYLERANPSAHSDLAAELLLGTAAIAGCRHWCPDPDSFAYCVVFVPSGRIIGAATGMRDILIPVAPRLRSEALAAGALADPKVGGDWTRFGIFSGTLSVDSQRTRLSKWLRMASDTAIWTQ